MCCSVKWPPVAEAQKDKACFFPAAQLKLYSLTFATLLTSSEFKDSYIYHTLSSDNKIKLHGGNQTEKFPFFKDEHFFCTCSPVLFRGVHSLFFSFCFTLPPRTPPARPLLRAHPLPAASPACLAEKCRLSRDW